MTRRTWQQSISDLPAGPGLVKLLERGHAPAHRYAKRRCGRNLTQTEHGEDFVLKGGILLAAYGARRPTKDVDAEAISFSMTADNIAQILSDIAAVEAEDGVEFDLGSLDVEEIREEADYPGLRVRVNISIGTFSGKLL